MPRQDFRFAIDGLDLSEDDASFVAARVQEAGLSALAELGHRPALGISVGGLDSAVIERLKWRGYWLLQQDALRELGPVLDKSGLLDRMQGGFGG